MQPGTLVRVAGRKGDFKLVRRINGGWLTVSPRHRLEAVRDAQIKGTP